MTLVLTSPRQNGGFDLILENIDCILGMKKLPDNSVDAVVTDPPAGISFMGKKWDADKGGRDEWIKWLSEAMTEALRVLKPGGHAFVWALPRTSHWTAMAMENSGFTIRDCCYHVFGQGFPKSMDVSKQLDKMAGVKREIVGTRTSAFGDTEQSETEDGRNLWSKPSTTEVSLTGGPVTPEAKQWEGWGTALKPAVECWWLGRKPLEKGLSVAENVLKYGTGAINIDGCRVPTDELKPSGVGGFMTSAREDASSDRNGEIDTPSPLGRFPANLILDGSPQVVGLFPDSKSSGGSGECSMGSLGKSKYGKYALNVKPAHLGGLGDSGSAARFFKSCEYSANDYICGRCYMPYAKDSDKEWKNISVTNAEKNTATTQATVACIAPQNATQNLNEKIVQFVKSVENMCDLCVTDFVQEVVEISNWDSSKGVSPVMRDFIGNSSDCILIQNLAFYAETWESIDTTPTTQSLSKLFGCANRAIINSTQEIRGLEPSRFLYCPKASVSERNAGLEGFEPKQKIFNGQSAVPSTDPKDLEKRFTTQPRPNSHPTVKPIALMEYLIKMITPPHGIVLDPFMGSGSTGVAAKRLGYEFIGFELDPEYFKIAEARCLNFSIEDKLACNGTAVPRILCSTAKKRKNFAPMTPTDNTKLERPSVAKKEIVEKVTLEEFDAKI